MTSCVSVSGSLTKKTRQSPVMGRVIIDAGHGGRDAGAVSSTGLKEKDLTLDMALRIRRLMRKVLPNVEVILTRQDDRYVSLEKRIKTAEEKSGDVFLSLHINSSEEPASGFELYSLDVANNSHAEKLAKRENALNEKESRALQFVLADLRANSFRQESDELARLIAHGLKNQLKQGVFSEQINDRGYNQALFHVLFVKMPAILAEMFFLSNPKDESLLRQRKARELCARGMVLGVMKFLENKHTRAQK